VRYRRTHGRVKSPMLSEQRAVRFLFHRSPIFYLPNVSFVAVNHREQ